VDIRDSLQQNPFGALNPLGQPQPPQSDGKTDYTSQIFMPYNAGFRGGVRVTTGNFDGDYTTPDSLVTGPGPGGSPHIIVWRMQQDSQGRITVAGIQDQFMAYDPRFIGGVHITTGDLDGDGKAELIVAPDAGGGPHVKIYKLGANGHFYVAAQFMAYDPGFQGGVNVASGQGYSTPVQVQQVVNAQLPANASGNPASNFSVVPYVNGQQRPGLNLANPALDFPLVGGMGLFDPANPLDPFPGPSNVIATRNPLTFFPYVTVGSSTIQYLSGNLLNNYGNVAYAPNVVDLVPPIHQVPPEEPLVFASWPAMSMHPPDFAYVPDRVYGPFVQTSPAQNNIPPIVTRFTPSSGQVNARNQLILGAGPGGGPHVKVIDFVDGPNGTLVINNQIGFMAFDPSFRGGVNVAIGSFVDLPNPSIDPNTLQPVVRPDNTDPQITAVTFPYTTDTYRQFTAQILATPASGGGQAVVWSDYNPAVFDPTVGTFAPARRTSITQLDLRPTLLDTTIVTDTSQFGSLNGFTTTQDVTTFNAIDPQFRGQVLAGWSGLTFNGSALGTNSLGQPYNAARAQMLFGAGPNPNNGAARGSHVKIYDKLGPNPVGLPFGASTSNPAVATSQTPVDDFYAFTSGFFPNGLGGVTFGFGTLANPTRDIITLNPITVNTISDPILV
jgi:hypothetical protein